MKKLLLASLFIPLALLSYNVNAQEVDDESTPPPLLEENVAPKMQKVDTKDIEKRRQEMEQEIEYRKVVHETSFVKYDTNEDDVISVEEFMTVKKKEAEEEFLELDLDQDGYINLDEMMIGLKNRKERIERGEEFVPPEKIIKNRPGR